MDYEIDFLDPYEELEMRYADEMEVLRELEEDDVVPNVVAKKSLNFDNIPVNINTLAATTEQETPALKNSTEKSPQLPLVELDKSPTVVTNNTRISSSQEPSCSYSTSSKRSVDELFGEIGDIDFDDELSSTRLNNLQTKRLRIQETKKPEEELIIDKDALTISRILECRKKVQSNQKNNDLHLEENAELQKSSDVTLTRRVPKWAFVSLRNGKNEKFYARLHSDDVLNTKITAVSEQCKTVRLLAIPFETVMAEANAIMDKKCADEEKARDTFQTNVQIHKPDESELWVQKYKPMTYVDLLSDEGTNRTLLTWIKLWDKVVFGREPKVRPKIKSEKDEPTFFRKNYQELNEELDESGCPKHKLVLLCGPPGLGKTTLAHLIARLAGYNVVEMNASDDRSPDIFKQQLEAATQMKAVIGRNPKPNCLVIDEIDGAPSASIDVLMKFARGEMKSKTKKGAKATVSALKRPIICICNDVYVPALRALRQMAFIINFPPTPLSRLAQRLLEVARIENIKTDIGAMLALCEKSSNDIRTCISTIYCLKDKPIRVTTIHNTNVGSKDMRQGLFSIWQEIFMIQNRKINIRTETNNKSERDLFLSRRMESILKCVQGNSDYDKLTQGVYENFLNVKITDSSMKNVSKGLSWFCFMDELRTNILNSQTYTLMTYMPYCFVTWGLLFSNYQKPKLNFPNMMFEIMSRQTKNSQIIQEVLGGMEPRVRAYCHQEQLLLDTLPFFSYLLNPSIRPISIQLFSNTEKEALRQLVNTMLDYNLNFVQERTQIGSYEFIMDPNIEEVAEFPGITKNKTLKYSLKLMISREIDLEKLRRLEQMLRKNVMVCEMSAPAVATQSEFLGQCEKDTDIPMKEPEPSKSQNHLQKLTPKVIKKSHTFSAAKDFFGRIVEKPTGKHEITKIDEIIKSDIWFHFKEGYSNAVRRFVYMKDL